jgi:hypothetical protein
MVIQAVTGLEAKKKKKIFVKLWNESLEPHDLQNPVLIYC